MIKKYLIRSHLEELLKKALLEPYVGMCKGTVHWITLQVEQMDMFPVNKTLLAC